MESDLEESMFCFVKKKTTLASQAQREQGKRERTIEKQDHSSSLAHFLNAYHSRSQSQEPEVISRSLRCMVGSHICGFQDLHRQEPESGVGTRNLTWTLLWNSGIFATKYQFHSQIILNKKKKSASVTNLDFKVYCTTVVTKTA